MSLSKWPHNRSQWLAFLLLILTVFIRGPCAAQNTEEVDDPNSWTFKVPGKSSISFFPGYSSKQHQRLGLVFRTHQSDALLLYHKIEDYNQTNFHEIQYYELKAELIQGVVRVRYRLNQFLDDFTIGQNLNDNEWHRLQISLDINTGGFAVSLDFFTSQNRQLRAFKDIKKVLKWSELLSVIYYGGIDTRQDFIYESFIGCMKDLKFENSAGKYVAVKINTQQNMTQGCQNMCYTESPCQYNSTCINHYYYVTCECFGTDYEGQFCEKEGVTKVTLRGYEWLTYKLYDVDTDGDPSIEISRISMEFKTDRNTGILLYAVGGAPHYSHIIALLHSGFVNVSIAFENQDWDFSISIELDRNRTDGWHNLTLVHKGTLMYVHLDSKTKSKDVKNYLNLDPHVYFGGGQNFVKTKGLKVTQNFIGCLQNIYFNDVSVLYDLKHGNGSTQYHGGPNVQYGCEPIQNTPLSFPRIGTLLSLNLTDKYNLELQMQFRTIQETAILLYIGLTTFDSQTGTDSGILEVWLLDGYPNLKYVPFSKRQNITQSIPITTRVNDNLWHTLHLTFKDQLPTLTVDGVTVKAKPYGHNKPKLRKKLYVGYDFSASSGFVGCIRNVYLQGDSVDLISIVHSEASNGPILDGCHLVDFCKNSTMCEHNSKCVSDWSSMHCDCSDAYEGSACHFAKYRRDCNDYYLAGERQSGVYRADLDGNGPLPPTYVNCEMSYVGGFGEGEIYGQTIVTHNLIPNTTVQSKNFPDLRVIIEYREMSKEHLQLLTSQSAFCEQLIEYQCLKIPIRLGKKLWFKAANERIVKSIGNPNIGTCPCSLTDSCYNKYKCNCDAQTGFWQMDFGYNTDTDQLPVTEIYAERYDHIPDGIGKINLGPLKCWGNKFHDQQKAMTFKSPESYIQAPSWTHKDLIFSFRTFKDKVLLIHQADDKGNYITIHMENGQVIKFKASANGHDINMKIKSDQRVDNGQWHIVKLEQDNYNIRLTFGSKTKLIDIQHQNLPKFLAFPGYMYIGGVPSNMTDVPDIPGLVGCMRDLVYNNQFVELSLPGLYKTEGVNIGCLAACHEKPCQNGGTCVEQWGSYKCVCINKWSHLGYNCENNIDEDMVTFVGTNTSYLFYDKTNQPSILNDTIVMSFRTIKMNALLLYMHDNYDNFVQLELVKENRIVLTFNSFDSVISASLECSRNLNNEKWHQIVAEVLEQGTRLQVGNDEITIPHKRFKKKQEIFDKKVSVEPPSYSPQQKHFVYLYVGGVIPQMTQLSRFKGCIRGLKIGDHVIDLRNKSRNEESVKNMCKGGCISNPCLNDGFCNNEWGDGNFTCDCSQSSYTGRLCNLTPCGDFNGNSYLDMKFDPAVYGTKRIREEKLLLTFQTKAKRKQVLLDIYNSDCNDYLTIFMNSEHRILMKTDQGVGNYIVSSTGTYNDGKLHEISYQRKIKTGELELRVDKETTTKTYPLHNLDNIDHIRIGGASPCTQRMDPDYKNFKGKIWNVIYTPQRVQISPLKEYLDNVASKKRNVSVVGELMSCNEVVEPQTSPGTTSKATSQSSATPLPRRTMTMPTTTDWSATIFFIKTLSPPITTTTPTTTTTTTTLAPTTSQRNFPEPNATGVYIPPMADDMTIVLIVGLVITGILLITIIAILLMCFRTRKTHYASHKGEDVELKEPLHPVGNHMPSSPAMMNHMATFEEFSMITALLNNGGVEMIPNKENVNGVDPNNRFSTSSIPWIDDDQNIYPIYNRKKKRPASSISEVMEEMQRIQKAKELGIDPETDLTTPTVNEPDHTVDNITEGSTESKLARGSNTRSEADSFTSHGHLSTNEHNGDSGYEASSKPEGEDENTADNTADTISPDTPEQKTNIYDVNCITDDQEIPVELTNSKQKLLQTSELSV